MTDGMFDKLSDSVNKVSVGRVYDYFLGGTHNYAVDREFADEQLRHFPDLRHFARANRAFLGRAVRYAISEGIHQFLDIGSGLPTQGNVHEVADAVAPGKARVVYIDNEPIAHAHARILLENTADPDRHSALHADFFDGARLWPDVLDSGIDPTEPICLLTVALLHFMPPGTQPENALAFYRDLLPSGSLLALSHATVDEGDQAAQDSAAKVVAAYQDQATSPVLPRTRDEIGVFFGDFDLVDPGMVWLPQWRPDTHHRGDPARSRGLAGVARKP